MMMAAAAKQAVTAWFHGDGWFYGEGWFYSNNNNNS